MSNSNKTQPQKSPSGGSPLDPYTEFLQLPPGNRPPHLYELLELEIFCPHPERIQLAVRQQFRKIKPFEEHPERKVRERIQDVMTHIATARVVLSDPAQKREYDRKLAEHLRLDREALLRERTAARLPEYALRIVAGSASLGTRVELLPDRDYTIGSDARATISLHSMRLADTHATLTYNDEDWILRAAGEHIVLVNDARCVETALMENDNVDLGGYRFRFARMDDPQSDPARIAPPMSLIVREGPSITEPVFNALAPASILIGHCDTALWQLGRSGVSLHHARIESAGPLWEIADLQSETGTFLNGGRIARAVLKHRDELALGSFKIQVRLRR